MRDDFIHIRLADGGPTVTGSPACTLGRPFTDETGRRQGVFLEWRWDGRRLTACTDRYGVYPALYFVRDREIGLSPNVFRLLDAGAPAALDYPAIAAFLHYAAFLGEDTPFAGIKTLPPGGVLQWCDGRLTVTEAMPANAIQPMSRDDALDGLCHHFARAVERLAPASDNVAVLLTGGKDSRRILFELLRQGRRPRFAATVRNFPFRTDEDARIAPLVAAAVGVPHRLVEQDRSRFAAEMDRARHTNLCSEWHSWMVALGRFLADDGVATVYDGVFGDILCHCGIQTAERVALIRAGRFRDLADDLWRRRPAASAAWRDAALRLVLGRREADRLSHQVAIDRAADDLRRFADQPHPIRAWKAFNGNRRNTALGQFGVMSDVAVVTPYLDHDLYDFLDSMPHEVMRSDNFRRDAVNRAYPQHAHLPYLEDDMPDPTAARRDRARLARAVTRHLLRHPRPRWISQRRLAPRLLACLANRRFAARSAWWLPTCLYLIQIDEAVRRRRS